MNKINNKNLILFGIIGLALFLSVIPSNADAASSASRKCLEKGTICGYDRDISRNQTYPNYYAPSNNNPEACKSGGYSCGSNIDQTVRNTYPTMTTVAGTQVSATNPKPIIDSVSPNTVDSGKGEMWVTVYGANFVNNSVVKFNSGDRATAYISSTKLQAKLTDTDINGSGEYLITVFNPLPGGGYSNAEFFTILGGPTEAKAGEELESSLAAGALFGAGGFFPNSFMGWLLLAILILIGVIAWRKFYYTDEKKHTPLKHA
ncbi:MAG: hypothetical protein QG644_124 [Patescibacteria group bacterium]|nr:hypothetical protein [Patescibacteria group bacterium]